MPLTPEANLYQLLVAAASTQTLGMDGVNILDKLFGLDVGHAVDTGNAVTIHAQLVTYFLRTLVVAAHRRR